ncbi:MAG: hypothetical protein ACLFQK_09405 [Fibrobacterota bacterium]
MNTYILIRNFFLFILFLVILTPVRGQGLKAGTGLNTRYTNPEEFSRSLGQYTINAEGSAVLREPEEEWRLPVTFPHNFILIYESTGNYFFRGEYESSRLNKRFYFESADEDLLYGRNTALKLMNISFNGGFWKVFKRKYKFFWGGGISFPEVGISINDTVYENSESFLLEDAFYSDKSVIKGEYTAKTAGWQVLAGLSAPVFNKIFIMGLIEYSGIVFSALEGGYKVSSETGTREFKNQFYTGYTDIIGLVSSENSVYAPIKMNLSSLRVGMQLLLQVY